MRLPCAGMGLAYWLSVFCAFLEIAEALAMDLAFWLPLLFALGLTTMGLLFAFVVACEHV
jgi:hypothetical protein